MQYAKIENGRVVSTNLPKVGILRDGSTVSGYDLLNPTILKNEGWLPLTEDKPIFDGATQYLTFDQYVISTGSVVARYKVVDIVVPEPAPYTPTNEERIAALEAAMNDLILGV